MRIPDAEVANDATLLRRALLALRPGVGEQPRPRWSLVSEALGYGPEVSAEVCKNLSIDPNEDVVS